MLPLFLKINTNYSYWVIVSFTDASIVTLQNLKRDFASGNKSRDRTIVVAYVTPRAAGNDRFLARKPLINKTLITNQCHCAA